MFKKTKHGVEIDSQATDKTNAPKFGKRYPPKAAIESAGREMKQNQPRQLAKTKAKFGKKKARAQKIAIMLSKARKGI
jgi:hypothetical protein